MNQLSFLFCLLAFASFGQGTLTLEQVVSNVLERNFSVQIQRNLVEVAENDNNIGNAGYLPAVSINGEQNWSSNNTRQEFFSGQVNEADGAKSRSTAIAARLDWTFFDGFRMFATDKRLQLQEDNARYQLTAEMEMQIYQAAILYYTILQTQELTPVYEDALDLSRERYSIVELKQKNGAATQLELLQARLDLTADSSVLLQHQKYLSDLKVDMNTLMGLPVSTPFTIEGSILPEAAITWESALAQAQEQNTQLLLAKSAIAITEMERKEARSAYYPQLGVYAQYAYGSSQNQVGLLRSNQTHGPGAGFTLRWTILDRLSTYTALKNNQLFYENAQLAEQQQQQFVEAELLKTFNEYLWAKQNLELEQQTILNTSEAFEIARVSFENGSMTSLELREIQYAIVQAESRLSAARLTLKTAELNLSLTTGNFKRLLN